MKKRRKPADTHTSQGGGEFVSQEPGSGLGHGPQPQLKNRILHQRCLIRATSGLNYLTLLAVHYVPAGARFD